MSYKDRLDYKIVNWVFVFAVCGTALSLPMWAFLAAIGDDKWIVFRAISMGMITLTFTSLIVGWLTMQEPK